MESLEIYEKQRIHTSIHHFVGSLLLLSKSWGDSWCASIIDIDCPIFVFSFVYFSAAFVQRSCVYDRRRKCCPTLETTNLFFVFHDFIRNYNVRNLDHSLILVRYMLLTNMISCSNVGKLAIKPLLEILQEQSNWLHSSYVCFHFFCLKDCRVSHLMI